MEGTEVKLPPLPPYLYGRETGPNERVWSEASMEEYARQAVLQERERVAGVGRVLKPADPFCPKCGHNRDKSSVSSIDHGEGRKSCQMCGAEWLEPEDTP